MGFDQFWIVFTGCTSLWLIHDDRRWVRLLACLLGTSGQPAWAYAAWVANQWGILLVDAICTVAWVRGIIKNWR